jgi:hypothetical protein
MVVMMLEILWFKMILNLNEPSKLKILHGSNL